MMIAIAIVVLALAFGGMIYATSRIHKPPPRQQAVVDIPASVNDTTPTTARTNRTVPSTTTTTSKGGLTQYQIEHPEGAIMTGEQLAYRYPQSKSGLTPAAYANAVKAVEKFSLASSTGQGEAEFKYYYDEIPNDPWLDNYKLVFATAQATDDPTIAKGLVWYSGKEKATGLQLTLAREGYFLKRSGANILDFKPMVPEPGTSDPDLGVQIFG